MIDQTPTGEPMMMIMMIPIVMMTGTKVEGAGAGIDGTRHGLR
jgi:hypothetical protein